MNRVQALLEQRAAKLAEWNTAAEAGDDTKASECDAEVTRLDGEITKARETQAKMDEARARGEAMTAELSKPVREPITTHEKPRTVTAGEDRAKFASLAHQCREVRHLEITKRPLGGGVLEMRDKYERRYAQGAGEDNASEGGLLVQEEFVTDLMPIILADGSIPGMCQQVKVGGNRLILNRISNYTQTSSFTGFATSYWVGEGTAPTASQPTFERISLELRKVAALVYATDELLEDAPQFQSALNANVGLELQMRLGEEILNGGGGAEPLGIVGNAPTIDQAAETGQAAQTFVVENAIKMRARHLGMGGSPVWLYNKGLETQFPLMNAAVGVGGGLVFLPPGGVSAAPYASLFGYPMIPCQHCQARGTSGDIVLADMNAYALAMKASGPQSAVSMHVAFTTFENAFRFSLRAQGHPRISTAVTPRHAVSGETLSPFVTLATRS